VAGLDFRIRQGKFLLNHSEFTDGSLIWGICHIIVSVFHMFLIQASARHRQLNHAAVAVVAVTSTAELILNGVSCRRSGRSQPIAELLVLSLSRSSSAVFKYRRQGTPATNT
jgi:hypothetical protein